MQMLRDSRLSEGSINVRTANHGAKRCFSMRCFHRWAPETLLKPEVKGETRSAESPQKTRPGGETAAETPQTAMLIKDAVFATSEDIPW